MVFKSILGAVSACLLVISFNSNGALVEIDYFSSGDALITRDTSTGLEWLDVTETIGMDYSQTLIETQSGGLFEGWSIADKSLVGTLWTNGGIPGSHLSTQWGNANLLIGYYEPVKSMIDFLGYSYAEPENDYWILYGRTSESYSEGYHNLTLLWATSYYGEPEGNAWLYSGQNAADSSTSHGTYLYQETSPVPIPSAVWLFGSGLIGLIGVARRKEA